MTVERVSAFPSSSSAPFVLRVHGDADLPNSGDVKMSVLSCGATNFSSSTARGSGTLTGDSGADMAQEAEAGLYLLGTSL